MSNKTHLIDYIISNNSKNPNSLFNKNNISYKLIYNKEKLPFQNNNDINSQHNNNKNSLTSRNLQINSEKILIEKNSKNSNLFAKIKKLLGDFQKENDEKNRLYNPNKSKNKKSKNKKKLKQLNTLLVPQKKVYYNVPKVKSQIQLNRYLINDFKEVDSEQAYIIRSLKYKKMNEELDELVYLNQIKEAEKIGVSENIMKEYQNNNEFLENEIKFGSCDNERGGSEHHNHLLKLKSKVIEDKKKDKRHSIFKGHNYDLSLRRLYTENINSSPMKNNFNKDHDNINNVNIKVFEINSKNNNPSITTRTKNSENENSILENNDTNKINKTTGIKFLINKRNENNINKKYTKTNITDINENKIIQKKEEQSKNQINIKKKKTKRNSITLDKYSISNNLYKNQKLEYKKYLKNKYIMRGKNFTKQIALLLSEKERFGIQENDIDINGHPKLNRTKLLYQIQLRDIFTNSFNSMRLLNEGDQDLDLDNLNKIKDLIKEYEIEMARVMKNSDNPSYITKHFNKSTVGKFQSSRGIYM